MAIADSLADKVARDVENPGFALRTREDYAVFAEMRRAVDVAPLSGRNWSTFLQIFRFLTASDSAVALANAAARRWPDCPVSSLAVQQAADLATQLKGP